MNDKSITIILTIQPTGKNGKRPVTVAAAPEGELPLMLSGVFADRHQLCDQAFGALIKRKPVTPKVTADAGTAKKAKATPRPTHDGQTSTGAVERGTKPVAADESEVGEPEADQIGPADAPEPEAPEAPAEEALPEIEGDDDGQQELQLEGSDG